MITAYIALGSNLGDRSRALNEALQALERTPGIAVEAVSDFLQTQAVLAPGDTTQQPPYLNAVARLSTTLSARQLLQRLLTIEAAQGRERTTKWAARTVDLDLVLYGDQIIEEPGLSVPHPHFPSRRFVLQPLAQLAPQLLHPVLHRTVAQLLAAVCQIES
jgi:2-amino-4-hydroxy-6-hydroxymethyldihydropteridine diphosphokinase